MVTIKVDWNCQGNSNKKKISYFRCIQKVLMPCHQRKCETWFPEHLVFSSHDIYCCCFTLNDICIAFCFWMIKTAKNAISSLNLSCLYLLLQNQSRYVCQGQIAIFNVLYCLIVIFFYQLNFLSSFKGEWTSALSFN